MEGKVKNGYTFEKSLGRGAYGEVWKVKKEGKVYAIKIIQKKENDDSAEIEEDFAKNYRLHFPFLVYFIESFHEEVFGFTYVFLVMEYCEHGNLTTLLKTRLETARVMKIFVQLALALYHLDLNRILHRDIKPENVFLNEKDDLKLGDFGCFKMLWNSETQTFKGTGPYICPEVFLNRPYGPRADVWSFGVLMYQVCTLKLPFVAPTEYMLSMVIVEKDFEPIPADSRPPELVKAIHWMLQKNEADRPFVSDLLCLPFVVEFARQPDVDLYRYFPSCLQMLIGAKLQIKNLEARNTTLTKQVATLTEQNRLRLQNKTSSSSSSSPIAITPTTSASVKFHVFCSGPHVTPVEVVDPWLCCDAPARHRCCEVCLQRIVKQTALLNSRRKIVSNLVPCVCGVGIDEGGEGGGMDEGGGVCYGALLPAVVKRYCKITLIWRELYVDDDIQIHVNYFSNASVPHAVFNSGRTVAPKSVGPGKEWHTFVTTHDISQPGIWSMVFKVAGHPLFMAGLVLKENREVYTTQNILIQKNTFAINIGGQFTNLSVGTTYVYCGKFVIQETPTSEVLLMSVHEGSVVEVVVDMRAGAGQGVAYYSLDGSVVPVSIVNIPRGVVFAISSTASMGMVTEIVSFKKLHYMPFMTAACEPHPWS